MYPLKAFFDLLQPTAELNIASPIHIVNAGPVVIKIPHIGWAPGYHLMQGLPVLRMSIHPSPVRKNVYKISIYHHSGITNVGSFVRYVCTISDAPGAAVQWERSSEVPALIRGYFGLTYSGYVLQGSRHDVYHSLQIPFERSVQLLPDPPLCFARDVSAYGCVVATLTPDSVLVYYYE
jgi:hypothetical protein